jgi:hypothetical protein
MNDKQLIDELAILYNCIYSNGKPNRTKLAGIIHVEYPTLASWYQNNQIPQYKSYGKLYMETLYKLKKSEKELELYKDIDKSFKALRSFQKEHNEK